MDLIKKILSMSEKGETYTTINSTVGGAAPEPPATLRPQGRGEATPPATDSPRWQRPSAPPAGDSTGEDI